jgi:hypothetical protein
LSFQLSFSLEEVAPQLHPADRLVKWRMMVPPHHFPQRLTGPSFHLDRPASDHRYYSDIPSIPAKCLRRPQKKPMETIDNLIGDQIQS